MEIVLFLALVYYVGTNIGLDLAFIVRGKTPPGHEYRMAKLAAKGNRPARHGGAIGRYFSALLDDAVDWRTEKRRAMREVRRVKHGGRVQQKVAKAQRRADEKVLVPATVGRQRFPDDEDQDDDGRPDEGPTVRPVVRQVDENDDTESAAGDDPADIYTQTPDGQSEALAPDENTGGAVSTDTETAAPSGEIVNVEQAVQFTEKMVASTAKLASVGQDSMESLAGCGIGGELLAQLAQACEGLQGASSAYQAARNALGKHENAEEVVSGLGDEAADDINFYKKQ